MQQFIYDADVTDLQHLKGLTEIGLKQAEKLKSRETKDDKVSVDDSLPHVLCDREGQDKKKSFSQLFHILIHILKHPNLQRKTFSRRIPPLTTEIWKF